MSTEYWRKLLDEALSGDKEAFGVLCQDYLRPKILTIIRKKLQDKELEEDVLHTVFECLFASVHRIMEHDLESFTCFVQRIAANECINRIRARHRGTRHVLSEKSFAAMKSIKIPETVIQRLQPLRDREVIGHQKFTNLLRRELKECPPHNISTLVKLVFTCTEKSGSLADRHLIEQHPEALNQKTLIAERKLYELVYDAIRKTLNEQEWRIFKMKDLEERPYREIAEQLGIGLSSAHDRHDKIWDKIRNDETLRARWSELKEELSQ